MIKRAQIKRTKAKRMQKKKTNKMPRKTQRRMPRIKAKIRKLTVRRKKRTMGKSQHQNQQRKQKLDLNLVMQ